MHLVYGSVFRIEFSYIDRVRHKFVRIGSFSKFSIIRKFAFIFVSDFTVFVFVFVFVFQMLQVSDLTPLTQLLHLSLVATSPFLHLLTLTATHCVVVAS